MPKIAKLFGGAGTGKTTELLRLMGENIKRGLSPSQIGFVTFTRAGRAEASERAALQFNCSKNELEKTGWFRTIHSTCYRCLEVGGELLASGKDDKKWIEDVLGVEVSETPAGDEKTQLLDGVFADSTDADVALRIWSKARSRLESLRETYDVESNANPTILEYADCEYLADRYEQAKRLAGRCDFTDLLARFAGYTFTMKGPEKATPEGQVPNVPVWFFDEHQDTSALLDAVCKRLIEPCQYAYLVGDSFQSIYGFGGSEPRFLRDFKADHTRIMPQSYRCGPGVHNFGEMILQGCSDYYDREIKCADHQTPVSVVPWGPWMLADMDPADTWLLLARTNYQASRLARLLDARGIPWSSTKGTNKWDAPVRHAAFLTLHKISSGERVSLTRWGAATQFIPVKDNDKPMLVHGWKTKLGDKRWLSDNKENMVSLETIDRWGAAPALLPKLRDTSWRKMLKAEDYCLAIENYGQGIVDEPTIKVGTIHSAKGREADNVLLLTTTNKVIHNAVELCLESRDEESRVWYVGATRARKNLMIVEEENNWKSQYRRVLP